MTPDVLFGSAGDPHIPDHITLWGLRLKICQGFDQYANVRPTRILPGIETPLRNCRSEDLDWVIVRENSEGEYAGQGGRSHRGFPEEVATEVAIFTRAGVTRIMRYAFALARSRPLQMFPHWIDPALLAPAPEDQPSLSPDAYAAHVLACFLRAATEHHRDGGLLVEYGELPEATASRVLAHFGLEYSEDDRAAMRAAARQNVKQAGTLLPGDRLAGQLADQLLP